MTDVNQARTTRSGTSRRIRRRSHFIDQALEIVAILDVDAPTVADVRQRRRHLRERFGSKGRICVLEHLGRALRPLHPLELDVYRTPRITWALIRTVARAHASTNEVVSAFRGAIACPPADRRRRRRGRRGASAAGDLAGRLTFDPVAARANPAAYLGAAVDALVRSIAVPLRAAINATLAEQLQSHGVADVGQSLTMLMTALARNRPQQRPRVVATPEQDLALLMIKRLEELHRMLAM